MKHKVQNKVKLAEFGKFYILFTIEAAARNLQWASSRIPTFPHRVYVDDEEHREFNSPFPRKNFIYFRTEITISLPRFTAGLKAKPLLPKSFPVNPERAEDATEAEVTTSKQ